MISFLTDVFVASHSPAEAAEAAAKKVAMSHREFGLEFGQLQRRSL